MRKIIWLMHVSLDGFVADREGGLGWVTLSDATWDQVNALTDAADAVIFGGTTFGMMEGYWPTADTQPDASKHDIDHAAWLNRSEKIVFSKTAKKSDWAGTTFMRELVPAKIEALKAKPGKDILMIGSPTLAHSFLKLGLINEILLMINPIALKQGAHRLFDDDGEAPTKLKLISENTLDTGVIVARYTIN